MSRPPRCTYPNATFHVLNRFVDKHPFFQDDRDYEYFIRTYFDVARSFRITTYAYCLMPNHFHIALRTPDGQISRFLQRLLTRVAVTMNHRRGRTGHLFQGRSKTLLVEDELYFETLIAYILMNPVRAGICTDPFAYPWSSAAELLTGQSRVDVRTVAERIADRKLTENAPEWRAAIVRWLQSVEVARNEARFNDGRRGQFLASADFRKRTLALLERRTDVEPQVVSRTETRTRRLTDFPLSSLTWSDLKEIASRQVEHFSAAGSQVTAWDDLDQSIEEIAIYLAQMTAHWTNEQIRSAEGDRFSNARYVAVTRRIRRDPRKYALATAIVNRCQTLTF
jgi:REP element-mobilizing transposase RayT